MKPSEESITLLAQTNFRREHLRFGIKRADRRAHTYVIGKTGTGKSTLLANLASQDIKQGEGLAVIDPHGELVEQLRAQIPAERTADVIYLDPSDPACKISFNPLEVARPELRPLAASGLVGIVKKIWPEFWGPRMEYILRNVLLALLELPQTSVVDIPRMLDEAAFRSVVLRHVQNAEVKRFWLHEFAAYPARFRAEAVAPIQNKIGEFLVNPILRRVLGEAKSSFHLRPAMDEGKILLVNLAKGKIGEDAAALLGAILINQLSLAALSRADKPEAERRDFYLYIDEFPSFTTTGFTSMLSEMRKYRLSLILAHQYMTQLDEATRDAVLGNVGTTIAFRTGLVDAVVLEKQFHPEFSTHDLINLPNYDVYLRLMIDGKVSKPFSATTLPLQLSPMGGR